MLSHFEKVMLSSISREYMVLIKWGCYIKDEGHLEKGKAPLPSALETFAKSLPQAHVSG